MLHSRLLPTPACTLIVLLSGCAGGLIVGPDGGTFELPGGAQLIIPAGALGEDVTITPTLILDLEADGWAGMPGFAEAPNLALALEPHGLTFAQPVTLILPHAGLLDGLTILRTDDSNDPSWESAGLLERNEDTVSVSINGFSGYALTEVRNGACPCFDPGDVLDFRARAAQVNWTKWESKTADRHYVLFAQDVNSVILSAWGSPSIRNCEAAAVGDQGGSAPPGLLPEWMPGIDEVDYPTGTGVSRSDITEGEAQACLALMSTMFEGSPGSEVQVAATGVPAGEAVALDASSGGAWFVRQASESRLFPLGEAGSVAVATTPAGVGCTLSGGPGVTVATDAQSATFTPGGDPLTVQLACAPSAATEVCNGLDDDADGTVDDGFDLDGDGVTTCGPDGTVGTADDDCDDTDPVVHPGADELCNGVDDDCDGAAVAGETSDGDGDGVPDDCDANAAAACAFFDVSDVQAVLGQTGAVCLVDAVGAAIPVSLQELVTFTGAFVAYPPADTWEVAGVGTDAGGDTYAPFGCYQDGQLTGYCSDNGRPLLPAGSEATAQEHAACRDVAAYACAQ